MEENNMKRFFVLVALLALGGSLVFAGGGQQSAAKAAGKVEITFMSWSADSERQMFQNTLDTFNKSQDRINAVFIYTPYDGFATKLNTMVSANSLPDSAMMQEMEVLKWAASDMLLDLTDMYRADEDKPVDAAAYVYQGKTVAYSLAQEVLLLYYSKAAFDNAKLPYPPDRAENAWTWKQFVDVAKKLTKDSAGRTPNDPGFNPEDIVSYGIVPFYVDWFWPVFGVSNGGGWISEDQKTLLINTPETIEAAQALADLYLKDHVAPNPAVSIGDSAMAMLTGQVAMTIGGQWAIASSYKAAQEEGLEYGVAVLPKFKKPVTNNTGGPAVVFKSTKHPAEALEVMKQFYDPVSNKEFMQSGLWMPVLESYYQDEAKMKWWADHPDRPRPAYTQYKNAVIDYYKNNLVKTPWLYFSEWSRFSEILTPAMDPVWQGQKTAKEALNEAYPALKEIFDSRK
jgi:multiple sugar transport system substrate-binding protein